MHQNEGIGSHINERPVAAFQSQLKMEEGLPAPRKRTPPAKVRPPPPMLEMEGPPLRKRTQPAKVRAPKKRKEEVEEALVVPDPEIQSWDKSLDELFQQLRDHPKPEQVLTNTTVINDQLFCPLHSHVLDKKVSQKGWEYTCCHVKNCPIWLPWDQTLQQILLEIQFHMHPNLHPGLFYCQCQEPCKVGMTNKGPNKDRCFLTCAQKNGQRIGCKFFQWIDQDWSPKNAKLQTDLSQKFFANVVQKEIKTV